MHLGSLSAGVPSSNKKQAGCREACAVLVCAGLLCWGRACSVCLSIQIFLWWMQDAARTWKTDPTLQRASALEKAEGVSKLNEMGAALLPASWGQRDPGTIFLCWWHREQRVSVPVGDTPAPVARSSGSSDGFPHRCRASSMCWWVKP